MSLINQKNNWGANHVITIPNNVKTNESTILSWTTNTFKEAGVFSSKWDLAKRDVQIGDSITINVIVLPSSLSDKKEELEKMLKNG